MAATMTRDSVCDLVHNARARIVRQGSYRDGGWMRTLNVLDRSVQYAMQTVPLSIHAALLVEAGFCPFLLDDPARTDCVPPVTVARALDRIASHLVKLPKGQRAEVQFDADGFIDAAKTVAVWEQHPDRTERDVLTLLRDLGYGAARSTRPATRKASV